MALLSTLSYTSRSTRPFQNTINGSVLLATRNKILGKYHPCCMTKAFRMSMWYTVFIFCACVWLSLSVNNSNWLKWSTFPRRSNRGVEEKAKYSNVRDRRSPYPSFGLSAMVKKPLNWIHGCGKLHWATGHKLCFIDYVDVISIMLQIE